MPPRRELFFQLCCRARSWKSLEQCGANCLEESRECLVAVQGILLSRRSCHEDAGYSIGELHGVQGGGSSTFLAMMLLSELSCICGECSSELSTGHGRARSMRRKHLPIRNGCEWTKRSRR